MKKLNDYKKNASLERLHTIRSDGLLESMKKKSDMRNKSF